MYIFGYKSNSGLLSSNNQILNMSNALASLKSLIHHIDAQNYSHINSIETAADALQDLTESHPKKITQHFDSLLNIFSQQITHHNSECSFHDGARLSSSIAVFIESIPSLLKKNKQRLAIVIMSLLELLTKVNFEVNPIWLNPPSDFDAEIEAADNPEELSIRLTLTTIDKIGQAIGFQTMREEVKPIAINFYQNSQHDWRYRFSLLMFLSQIGSGATNSIEQIDFIVEIAMGCSSDPHPKVRHAFCHLIGQISDDGASNFQERYLDAIIFPLMNLTLKDPEQRVVAHAFACLTNLLDQLKDSWKLNSFLPDLISCIKAYQETNISLLKINSLGALSMVATMNNLASGFCHQIFEISSQTVVKQNKGEVSKNFDLSNQAISSLSMLLNYQDKSIVEPYLNHVVHLLISYQPKFDSKYFVSSWNRICIKFSSFVDLSRIYPQLLLAVTDLIENDTEEEAQEAIKTISNTIISFKQSFKPFAQSTIQAIKKMLVWLEDDSLVRQLCYNVFQDIVIYTKTQSPNNICGITEQNNYYDGEWVKISQQILQLLLENLNEIFEENNSDLDEFSEYFDDVGLILSGFEVISKEMKGVLSQSDILSIGSRMIETAGKIEYNLGNIWAKCGQEVEVSQKNYNHMKHHQKENFSLGIQSENQSGDESQNQLAEELQVKQINLQDSKLLIPSVFRSLFQISQPPTKFILLDTIITHLKDKAHKISLQSSTHSNGLDQEIIYCLHHIDDLLEVFVYEELSSFWSFLYNFVIQHCSSHYSHLRQPAVFGLGLIALKTPIHFVSPDEVRIWMELLWSAVTIPYNKEEEDKTDYEGARDNVVSALGKILSRYHQDHPMMLNSQIFKKWVEFLPLNEDEDEGDIQQDLLIQLLKTHPELLIFELNDLIRVIEIYALYSQKRQKISSNIRNTNQQKILQNTKESLIMMSSWPLYHQNKDYIMAHLNANHISSLQKL